MPWLWHLSAIKGAQEVMLLRMSRSAFVLDKNSHYGPTLWTFLDRFSQLSAAESRRMGPSHIGFQIQHQAREVFVQNQGSFFPYGKCPGDLLESVFLNICLPSTPTVPAWQKNIVCRQYKFLARQTVGSGKSARFAVTRSNLSFCFTADLDGMAGKPNSWGTEVFLTFWFLPLFHLISLYSSKSVTS